MASKPKTSSQANGLYLPVDSFRGNNSEECTTFIQAIREAAWAEGKLRDAAWMADLASLYFSSKAMSWHAKLPVEVRQDWFKLEVALVDRWAPADEGDEFTQPVPAVAPKTSGADRNDGVMHGVLKAIPDDSQATPSYVQPGSLKYALMGDRETALR
ncbi:hypothetical protein FRC00_000144, partial [Tulasnella sp. 408]